MCQLCHLELLAFHGTFTALASATDLPSIQIPSYYALLDRVDYILSPQDGLLAVVDFYTAGKQPSLHEKAIGGTSKECGWLSRWFWQIWFDFDHVCVLPPTFAISVQFDSTGFFESCT